MEGAEWTTEALGLHKRERAGDLVRRLKAEFAPGGLMHVAQGKWYPGEPLPRWALGCHWRTDGRALWRDDALLADETRDYGHDADAARRFGRRLAERLGLAGAPLVAAREDWVHYAWREACRPIDRDPIAIPWAPQVPDDCSEVLARGLDRVVGWVLPLAWSWSAGGWLSAPWPFDTITLTPGSSPIGLRLPLDRLPQSALVEVEVEVEVEPAVPPPAWTTAPPVLRPPATAETKATDASTIAGCSSSLDANATRSPPSLSPASWPAGAGHWPSSRTNPPPPMEQPDGEGWRGSAWSDPRRTYEQQPSRRPPRSSLLDQRNAPAEQPVLR